MAAKYRTYVKTFFSFISTPNRRKDKNRRFPQNCNEHYHRKSADTQSRNLNLTLGQHEEVNGTNTPLVHMQYFIFYLFIININVTLTVLRLLNKTSWISPPIHLTPAVTIPFPTYFPLLVINHTHTPRDVRVGAQPKCTEYYKPLQVVSEVIPFFRLNTVF